MAMRTRRMFRLLSTVPRCAWPKHAPSIELFAKPMASACARSRNLDGRQDLSTRSQTNNRNATQGRNGGNGNHGYTNPQPRLRDRLCLLIRQHKLDPNLVKAYAADYCGTASIRDASRDLVEAFVNDIADRAIKDREALICHLNSYSKPQEVQS